MEHRDDADPSAQMLGIGYFHLVFTVPKLIVDTAYPNAEVLTEHSLVSRYDN